jgi:poly-beta-1,6-N-acetyl-D-glucosamine synthase
LLFLAFLAGSIVSCSIVGLTYALYFFLVLRNSKTRNYVGFVEQAIVKPLANEDLPGVTAIIPMYNEESGISGKLQNMAELDYPIDKLQVLLIDDCSVDKSVEVAESVLPLLRLEGKIVRNPVRMGANSSYNIGVASASNDLILRTDADVILSAASLRKAVKILFADCKLGAVTGVMSPVCDTKTVATSMEREYRSLFDRMSISESALHSTYPGGGGFTLIRKAAFSKIPTNEGSTDGNIALSIVRKGLRHIYVPESFSFELVSDRLADQMKQKVRRARRVIQSTIMNKDLLFNKKYEEFGRVIFPLRFSIFVICPLFFFVGGLATLVFSFVLTPFLGVSVIVGLILIFYLGTRKSINVLNLISTFAVQQFYLLLGLFSLRKKNGAWTSVKRAPNGQS